MTTTLTAREQLDRCYLEVRSRILDIAASLDRIDLGADAESTERDDRLRRLADAMKLVTDGKPGRAERVQMHFSLPYDPNWRG